MASLELVGWKPVPKVVALIELLRSQAGLSRSEAKTSVEELLSGESPLRQDSCRLVRE